LSELLLEIESVTDMTVERAAEVGRAYDEDPELRPRRVGGDPARIKVEGSLEELISQTGLPINWLTVRTNSRNEGFEGGEIVLRPGRGGYIGWPNDDGTKRFTLVPNKVDAGFLRSWTDADPNRLDRVATLFARLCEGIDACYGAATVLPRKRTLPPVDKGLGDVGWLNFFGPAFIERFPRLATVPGDSTLVANGGIVIRTTPTPWELDDAAKQPVLDAVGPDALLRSWGPDTPTGVHVPSYEEHMRHSPGSMEMPWIQGEVARDAARAEAARERRYASARKRRLQASEGRKEPAAAPQATEWSTSFDAEDWRSFGPHLFRRLGGELAGPMGKPLIEEIASAPHNHEESVAMSTDLGSVEVRWFIDDIDTVDIHLFGPASLTAVVEEVHDRWSEG
jgi:hypothetical protein